MQGQPLTDLAPGQEATVAESPPGERIPLRMRELGFVPGTSVAVVRAGAFGDPIEVELRGYRICIRRADLARVPVHSIETKP